MFISSCILSKSLFSSNFPTPLSLSFSWNFGILILVLFVLQFVSGLVLSFYVDMNLLSCLDSKAYLIKEVNFGWLYSYLHMAIPTFLFMFIYLHIIKNLLYPVYSFLQLWGSGLLLFLLFVIISFSGYSLVSGSMGYWAIIVVSNIFQYLLGDYMVDMLFYNVSIGGVSSLSMYKMFTYHYLISMLVFIFMFFHMWFLHKSGSSGMFSHYYDYFGFMLILLLKDFLVILFMYFMVVISICFCPQYFYSYDNFKEINIFKVPEEINSEWYLSMFFIALSSVDSKGMGVFFVILILFYLFFILMFSDMFGFSYISTFNYVYILLIVLVFMLISFYFYGNSLVSIPIFLIFMVFIFFNMVVFDFLFMIKIIYLV